MNFFHRHCRRLNWIALFAILGLSLAPTVSHALAQADGQNPWSEICTPQGMQMLASADAVTGEPAPMPRLGDALTHVEHCPFCGLGGAQDVPPISALAALALPDLAHATPLLFLLAPRPLFAWCSAQPRAPPALS